MTTTAVVKPRRPTTCRCPACNPLHVGLRDGGRHRSRKSVARKQGIAGVGLIMPCKLCKNTRIVPVDVAARYLMPDDDRLTVNFSKPLNGLI